MVGVDISSRMSQITADSGHYAYVACCDAAQAVQTFAPADSLMSPVRVLHMVVAADTFIYLGPLRAFFAAAAAALCSGGLLVFSIENLAKSTMRVRQTTATAAGAGGQEAETENGVLLGHVGLDLDAAVPGWGGELLSSSRHAHSPEYVAALAAAHGFTTLAMQEVVLRTESTLEIQGLMYVLSLSQVVSPV